MKEALKRAGHRTREMIMLVLAQFQDPYYQGVAAQIAFSLFLSIVPMLILLSQFLGLFSLSLTEIQQWITENVSVEGADKLLAVFEYSSPGINSLMLAVLALWAASRAQFALMRVADYTLTDGKVTGRGYVRDRLKSVWTMLVTIFTISFSLVVLAYGELILSLIFGPVVGKKISVTTWALMRWPLAGAMYFFMVSFNYYILPTNKVPFRDIIPGSIFASVGLLAVTYVYTIYTNLSVNYNILYGSFSNIVVLMLWFYFLAWVMCIGISFNRVWWATRPKNSLPIAEEAKAKRKPMNIF